MGLGLDHYGVMTRLQTSGAYFLAFLIMSLLPLSAHAVSGSAFRDGNGNGVKDAGEMSISGVVVKAYSNGTPEQLVGTATTGADGSYELTGLSGRLRIEFSLETNGCNVDFDVDAPAYNASNYGSSVQFVDAADEGINFGILNAEEYVTATNPTMFTTVFQTGNGEAGSLSGNAPAVFKYQYNNSGVPSSLGGTDPDPVSLVNQSQVGSTWGSAYSRQANRLFLAAFLRRHAPMGPNGSGAIYMIDPESPPSVTPGYFTLDGLGVATQASGSYSPTHPGFHGVIGDNGDYGDPAAYGVSDVDRALGDSPSWPTTDTSAFDQVGKVSLGDIDISADGQYLFVMNLYDRTLYRIDLQNPADPVIPTAAQVHAYDEAPWLTQSCTGGVARPFGLKYYRGKVYAGIICTGENDSTATDTSTRAYVYEIDPATDGAGAAIAVEFPMNYQRGIVGWTTQQRVDSKWYNWTGDWADLDPQDHELIAHPQPMLSDIEFDGDGSMILAFADRLGFQLGHATAPPFEVRLDDNTLANNFSGLAGGDILRVYRNPATCNYELEANGDAGPLSSDAITEAEEMSNYGEYFHGGPGTPNGTGSGFTAYSTAGREFYYGDYAELFGYKYPLETHGEGALGALAMWPSSGEVIATGMDPVSQVMNAAGAYKLNNTTGGRNSGYTLYHGDSYDHPDDPTIVAFTGDDPQYFPGGLATYGTASSHMLAKANGLGDIEIIGEIPPIEVGNYVWVDTDEDGIQDADESGLEGVTVQLVCGADSATTVTNSKGEYFFSNMTSGTEFLQPGSSCTLRVDTTQAELADYKLSPTDSDGQTDNDLWTDIRDSDGRMNGDDAEIIDVLVGQAGANNHGLDFGFIPAIDLAITKVADKTEVRRGETVTYTITVTNQGGWDASNVTVTDLLPLTYVTYVSHTDGEVYTDGVWDVGAIAAGETRALHIVVTVK